MCSKTIVGLLSMAVLCWVGLPAAGGPGQDQPEGIRDASGGQTQASLQVASASLKARNPNPKNGACGVDVPILSWTPGDTAVRHSVYIGRNRDLGPANLWGPPSAETALFFLSAEPGATYYWRVDEIELDPSIVHKGDIWCFTVSPATPCPPVAPWGVVSLCCDIVLSWPADPRAVKYDVYLDADWMAVLQLSPAAFRGSTTQTTFQVEGLLPGVTYFWCANAVYADGTVQQGKLWTFTTAACDSQGVLREWWLRITGTDVNSFWDKYGELSPNGQECLTCFEGPTNWDDNYGSRLSALLLPPESGDYTFWIASDDQSELRLSMNDDPAYAVPIARVNGWTSPRQWDNEPGQQSLPVTLSGGKKYYIEAIHKEGTGDDNIAVAWKGPGIPDRTVICIPFVESPTCGPFVAHSPHPSDGARIPGSTLLSWKPGREALQHDVYFSDDYEQVLKACRCACTVYRGRQDETTYDPGPLTPGTYYWRVDEINPDNPASPWTGCVWSFTIGDDCVVVLDDFESYTGSASLQLAWTGTPRPVEIERTVVHSGAQSMRMDYDNRLPPYHSEAQPVMPGRVNWAASGVTTLSLWFHGRPGSAGLLTRNDACPLYVRVSDTMGRHAVVSHPDPGAVLTDTWTRWQIPLTQFAGVEVNHLKEVAIGVGETRPDGVGTIYIDDICLR